jgi:hypothetical protein
MKLVEINWRPSDRQLRQFGLISLVALPLLGWWFCGRPGITGWTSRQQYVVGLLAVVGGLLGCVGTVRPQLLRPVFLAAMIVALPIGLVIGELSLLLIYFGLFAPLALFFRLLGRDALERKIDRQAVTYWSPKANPAKPKGVESYYRQS